MNDAKELFGFLKLAQIESYKIIDKYLSLKRNIISNYEPRNKTEKAKHEVLRKNKSKDIER